MISSSSRHRLGKILKDIHIPDSVLAQLEKSLLTDKGRDETIRKQQGERLEQRLSAVRHRLDQAYLDKLAGKISEEFRTRKSAEWIAEEQQLLPKRPSGQPIPGLGMT